ncbi:MAG TPA: response regulator [Bryobacteraceae bacterium]|nr:response regulator [Bryobacteraceae bacterium]
MSRIDPTLLGIFEAEQREHAERIRALVGAGDGAPLSAQATEEILRRAHTLKGAARAVGFESIELLAHRLEALFADVRSGVLAFDATARAVVNGVLDASEDVTASALAGGEEPDVSATLRRLEGLLGIAPSTPPPAATPPPHTAAEAPSDIVRVSAARVEKLVASSSQLLAATAVQMRARELEGLLGRIKDFQRDWAQLRKGHPGAPPPESIARLDAALSGLAREVRAAKISQQQGAWRLNQLAADVYDGSCAVRMTPADTVFGVFRKMVRDMAAEAGREIEFLATGMDVQADRLVLQALKDPVMHLLRNAISHGVELPAERIAAGKPETATVRLTVEAQGDRLLVTVADDGRGIDLARVREVAVSRGLLSPEDQTARDLGQLARLLLTPGFTTSGAVNMLSGLGMGLSVVEQQVSLLQGQVDFRIAGAPGTAVILSVPLAISLHHVLLVASGGHTYAFPSRGIDRLLRVRQGEMESVDGRDVIRTGAEAVPVAKLADLLGTPGQEPDGGEGDDGEAVLRVVVLEAGEFRLGVIVDGLLDEREVLVKELGLPPAMTGLSNGGIPLEDGTVAVALSPAALLERFRQQGQRPALKRTATSKPQPAATILVVDDSITTRSLEKSILEAHGYRVKLAVDGLEALEELRAAPADLVIADINMPRMNGFELLENIKSDPRLASIPVIMVTSLEDREDQNRGLSLGADAYIVKRKFDQKELLATVRQIL